MSWFGDCCDSIGSYVGSRCGALGDAGRHYINLLKLYFKHNRQSLGYTIVVDELQSLSTGDKYKIKRVGFGTGILLGLLAGLLVGSGAGAIATLVGHSYLAGWLTFGFGVGGMPISALESLINSLCKRDAALAAVNLISAAVCIPQATIRGSHDFLCLWERYRVWHLELDRLLRQETKFVPEVAAAAVGLKYGKQIATPPLEALFPSVEAGKTSPWSFIFGNSSGHDFAEQGGQAIVTALFVLLLPEPTRETIAAASAVVCAPVNLVWSCVRCDDEYYQTLRSKHDRNTARAERLRSSVAYEAPDDQEDITHKMKTPLILASVNSL